MRCIWAKLPVPPFTFSALWFHKYVLGIFYAFFILSFFFFLKYIFEGFTVVARRIPCRMNALSYLLILPLFEARGCFFRFCFLFCSSFFWFSYFLFSKDDVLENKSSKNWNFENPIQNVHQGWKWYVLAFLPRNNILFLNFFCLRREVLVFFSLCYLLYKSIISNWFK